MAGRRGQQQRETSFIVIAVDRLQHHIDGLSAAGGCCFLTKKSVDAADKVHSLHFSPGKPADKTQGNADTLLQEHILECNHGPQDSRGGSSQNAADVDYRRQSKQSMGLSCKVGCEMHFSVKRYMHPQLSGLYKVILSEACHSNHSKDAPCQGMPAAADCPVMPTLSLQAALRKACLQL